jgi:hypothetical protein
MRARVSSTINLQSAAGEPALVAVLDLVNEADDVDAAIAAGRLANADRLDGERRIYRVIEAARLIREVPRLPGVRTSSTKLTRYQAVLKAIGITRETAREWDEALDAQSIAPQYIAGCHAANPPREPTIAGLIDAWANFNAAPGNLPSGNANIRTDTACPACGYRWSGKPKCPRCEECPKCSHRWFK